MMKPDWKDAPEWAGWLARDSDGEWYWYEEKPKKAEKCWLRSEGKAQRICPEKYWRNSLEEKFR